MPAPLILALALAQQTVPTQPTAQPPTQQQQAGDATEQKNEAPVGAQPAPRPTELKPAEHLNNAVTEASPAAGGAVAGPVGAAVAPTVVHHAGRVARKVVHRRHHRRKPAPRR